ncbi:MAG: ABC transporter ATP-binding protein/permease [Ruminococcaceae bacterium]|nr:ABC transporter ATP-binding protein/permease [Oscillospiraceae bacterium]
MLEIKGLTKIYRSKTGEEVRALDRVDIAFPETGMVFILGKSGSGKSTLLNIMGGLDSYDSGEFIIKGKSSRDFAGSDFDAYRNTFIGFIFQEYNVLDDFTVGANIALALELQGKKASPEAIGDILAQVDLTTYAKRKPNELSGGQKQRVAIARALVKDPQIIMADEPTGALDSATGKQIFDTLKKLSATKLVLVVSHDRDFAERYADRIVELADGKIISDVTKHEHESEAVSEGIEKIGGRILRIKAGYTLTAEDLRMINAYLAENNADVLLSGDGRVNDELRSAAGISETGSTAVFEETNVGKDYTLKRYEKKDSHFIRSRLPMKNAVHMGASGLKHKRFRLVMTVFLSLIAFALFGFADTLAAYEKLAAAVDSLYDSNVRNASVTLGVRYTNTYADGDSYTYYNDAMLNDADVEYLRTQTGLSFVPVFTGNWSGGYHSGFAVTDAMKNYQGGSAVYTGKLHGLVTMTEDQLSSVGLTVEGRLPAAQGEIAITELMYRQFNEYGFVDAETGETIDADTLTMTNDGAKKSIIGKHIDIRSSMGENVVLKIVGVVNTHFDYERYADFLPQEENNRPVEGEDNVLSQMVLQMEIESEIGYGFHALGFAHADDIQTLSQNAHFTKELGTYMYMGNKNMRLIVSRTRLPSGEEDEKLDSYETTIQQVAGSDALQYLNITWIGEEKTALGENEIVLPLYMLEDLLPSRFTWTIDYDEFDSFMTDKYGASWTDENHGPYYTVYDKIRGAAVRYYPDISDYDELTEKMQLDVFPFFLASLGIELPEEDMTFTANIYGELESLLRGFSEDADTMSVNVENYQLSSILRALHADYATSKQDLSSDDAFLSKMIEFYYGGDLGDRTEEQIARDCVFFYANYYLSWGDLGFESNRYGLSGREIEALGKDIFTENLNIDSAELLNRISFTLSTYEWQDGMEVNTGTNSKNYTVVGFYDTSRYHYGDIAVSDTLLSEFEQWRIENVDEYNSIEDRAEHIDGIWAYAVAPMPKDKTVLETLVGMSYAEEGVDLRFEMKNYIMDTLDTFNEFIEIGSQVFLYVGLGFAVFSALLLMNFIATSISYKKREIGVLRAVGARSSDVFKIFFSEALMIALINFVCATVVVVAGVIVANNLMHAEGITVTLLSYGARQFILMLAVSVGVALLASFLPVYSIAKKKPVDAIKDR